MAYDPLAIDDETRHLLELYNTLEQRRRLYEQQKAMLQPNVPHEVILGLNSTLRELEMVDAKLRLPPIGVEVQEVVGPEGQLGALERRVRQIERDMRKLLGTIIEDNIKERAESAAWRTAQDGWRKVVDDWQKAQDAWRTAQDTQRQHGQQRTLRVVVALVVVQIVGLVLIVWILATLRARGL